MRRRRSEGPSQTGLRRGAIILLVFLTLGLAVSAPHPEWRGLFVLCFLSASSVVAVLVWKNVGYRWPVILGIALLLRLLVFPMPPCLSSDTYRYLWDGWLQVEGENPYHSKPADPSLSDFRDRGILYAEMNSQNYYSVYPPVSQLCFRLGGFLYTHGGFRFGYYGLKALFGLFELSGLVVVMILARQRPAVLLYAWNPLVFVETWGQAHSEAIAIGLLLPAVWCVHRRKPVWLAATLITLAGWVKLWPLLLLPLLVRRYPRAAVFRAAVLSAFVSLIAWAPYYEPETLAHVNESLDLYVKHFEFNGGIYYVLKHIYYAVTGTAGSGIGGPVAGQVLRGVLLAGLVVIYVLDVRTRREFAQSSFAVFVLTTVLAAAVHPWYALLSVALMPLLPRVPWHWVWFTSASAATYLSYIYPKTAWPIVWVVWLPWAVTAWLSWRRARPAQQD